MVEREIQVRQGLADLTTQSPRIGHYEPFDGITKIADDGCLATSYGANPTPPCIPSRSDYLR